jgi:hypothetical protein
MRLIRICILAVIVPLLVSGCAITHDYKLAKGIDKAKSVNIITNAKTREGFLETMISWLGDNGYQYNVLPEGSSTNEQDWVLTYNGQWSWDITIYMAKATIKAYKNGVFSGESTYSSTKGGFSLKKFSKADEIINKMMEKLFFGENI